MGIFEQALLVSLFVTIAFIDSHTFQTHIFRPIVVGPIVGLIMGDTATGFAVAHVPLDRYDMIETVVALGSIPITPYGTPSTYEVPEAIAPYIQEHDAVLLENHGALTVGSNLVEAYYKMETLELFAKINLNAYLLGGPKEISRKNIDKLINLRSYYGVKGRHPGYKHYKED